MSLVHQSALGGVILATWLCLSVPAGAGSADLGWGPTHAEWEQAAVSSTIRFGGVAATAVRRPDGSVEATLTAKDGAELAKLYLTYGFSSVLHMAAKQYGELEWPSVAEISYSGLEAPVLDWVNLQLYSWWKDDREIRKRFGTDKFHYSSSDLRWDGDFLRPDSVKESVKRAESLLQEITSADLHFGKEYAHSVPLHSGFVTYLWSAGDRSAQPNLSEVGAGNGGDELQAMLVWQQDQELLAFSLGPSQLRERYMSELRAQDLPLGYFPFQPTMLWANVQIRKLWQDYAYKDTSFPYKDTVGCDGLHWLDNSSLRPCCDLHDKCYSANVMFTGAPCSAQSWFWPLCGSTPGCTWRCQICNIQAISCFAINLHFHIEPDVPYYGTGIWWSWGMNPPTYCYLEFPGVCPSYCSACSY